MHELWASPGMTVTTVLVICTQLISLMMLWMNIHVFRNQSKKYQSLMKTFGNEAAWGTPGKILLPLYVISTVIAAVVMMYLFVFQPHLL